MVVIVAGLDLEKSAFVAGLARQPLADSNADSRKVVLRILLGIVVVVASLGIVVVEACS
jgi:hypothetical protein